MTEEPGTTRLAMTLAGVSGYVDGVGATYVAHVFVTFMSGNTTSTGIALGTADWGSFVHVGVAIPLYVVGVIAGALILHRGGRARPAVLLIVVALLVLFLVWKLLSGPEPPTASGLPEVVTLALLVVPMGMMNTVVRHVGPSSVGLGYVTGTLVSLGENLAGLITGRQGAGRTAALYGGLWLGFFLGAALGAFAVAWVSAWAVLLPALVLAVLALIPNNRSASAPLDL